LKEIPMSLLRWIPSFLGFPLGGWLAYLLVGSANSPLTAALAGAVAGTLVGAAQYLSLRPAVHWSWIAASTIGMGAGSALAAVATQSTTSVPALAVTGAIAGAVVGLGQGLTLRRGWQVVAAWMVTVSAAWTVGWVITANVIVDANRGYVTFGSSGALVATVLTGLVLRRLLGRRADPSARSTTSSILGHPGAAGHVAGSQQ
jgi:hypothetical protein